MSDGERKQIIAFLTNMYSQQDTSVALTHIPTAINDPEEQEFNDYFNFLQSIYLLQSDFINMDEQDIADTVTRLKLSAHHFKYPMQQLEAFNVS